MKPLHWAILGAFVAPLVTTAAAVDRVGADRSPSLATFSDKAIAIAPDHRQAIDRGVNWLLKATRANGMAGADIGRPADLGCTAMVGLALLAEGNTAHGGKHSQDLARVLGAVITLVDELPAEPRGPIMTTLVQRKIGLYADRFLAALFLSEIAGESGYDDPDVRQALQRLVDDIGRAQGKDGTWGDESWAPILGTVLGWESLRASSSCGMQVDASASLAGQSLIKTLRKDLGTGDSWMHEFYKKASSIRVLYSLDYRDDPAYKECVRQTLLLAGADSRPFVEAGGEEYLAFFLITECLMNDPQETGRQWYDLVSDRIADVQNADGSWTGHHCIVNRTFCTAAALLTLQAPNQCLTTSDF